MSAADSSAAGESGAPGAGPEQYHGSMTFAPRPHQRAMEENGVGHLRVLIADERRDRFELLAQVVTGLGHEVIAREIEVRRSAR